jgi:hypothetical protein
MKDLLKKFEDKELEIILTGKIVKPKQVDSNKFTFMAQLVVEQE